MKCNNCGNELKQGARFCTKCGTKTETAYCCAQCKTKLDPDDMFCPECGAKRDGEPAIEASLPAFGDVSVGDTITFGSYWQEAGQNGGKTPIEWLVLEIREDGGLLVISRYALECETYHEDDIDMTWENCMLRKLLNTIFMEDAFSKEEQEKIRKVTVENSYTTFYGTNGGNDTLDKVFLLSVDEVKKYFANDKERLCQPTKHALALNPRVVDKKGNCFWWLRSPGAGLNSAASVYPSGGIFDCGDYLIFTYAIRPALVLNP